MIDHYNDSELFESTPVLNAALNVAVMNATVDAEFVVRVGTEYYRKGELCHTDLANTGHRYGKDSEDVYVVMEFHIPGYMRTDENVAHLLNTVTAELNVRQDPERFQAIAEREAEIVKLQTELAALRQ